MALHQNNDALFEAGYTCAVEPTHHQSGVLASEEESIYGRSAISIELVLTVISDVWTPPTYIK